MAADVYLFGMTVLSTIHRCASALPLAGGYAEIGETYVCPGGEAMNAAMLLSGLGLSTALGGPHWGVETREGLGRYAERYGIDVSGVGFDAGFAGVRDVVLVGGQERAVLGWFGRYFSATERRWGEPDAEAIAASRIVAIDPFFPRSSERAAELAQQAGKPYVTIDCPYDGALHQAAAASVISREYRASHYPGQSDEALFREYASRGAGLSIFTSGSGPMHFGRAGAAVETCAPFVVDVKSTLGAGDTFRAGVVFALLHGFTDAQCVRFAAGLAAMMCTRLPIADHVPNLDEVTEFLHELDSSIRTQP
ncbi:MAG: carbohydrate kinase family protein [Myxococcales bacterium]